MKIIIPSMLQSYTNGEKRIALELTGDKPLHEVLQDLDRMFHGILFRFVTEQNEIRRHMKIYLNKKEVTDLDVIVSNLDELFITQALSGGSSYLSGTYH